MRACGTAAEGFVGYHAPYAQDGRADVLLPTLLEAGVRASELIQLRIEDVSLSERVVTIRRSKGAKRREVPVRFNMP